MAKGTGTMSDEEKEIDIESDEVNNSFIVTLGKVTTTTFVFQSV